MSDDSPKPPSVRRDKRLRLLLWYLLYKVPPMGDICRQDEIDACAHCRLSLDFLDAAKREFPEHWSRMLAKRGRRREFLKQNEYVHEGWTPPDPDDPRSRHFPTWALVKRAKGEEKMVYKLRFALRHRWNREND